MTTQVFSNFTFEHWPNMQVGIDMYVPIYAYPLHLTT